MAVQFVQQLLGFVLRTSQKKKGGFLSSSCSATNAVGRRQNNKRDLYGSSGRKERECKVMENERKQKRWHQLVVPRWLQNHRWRGR